MHLYFLKLGGSLITDKTRPYTARLDKLDLIAGEIASFARDGVTLLGRITGAAEHTVGIAPDLKENLGKSDGFEANICKQVDDYVARNGLDAPREELPQLRDGYNAPEVRELDLKAAGITTIVWAMGYNFDFSLVTRQGIPGFQ